MLASVGWLITGNRDIGDKASSLFDTSLDELELIPVSNFRKLKNYDKEEIIHFINLKLSRYEPE